jgi:hypothetical protein
MELRVFSRRILSLNGQHRSLTTCAKLGLVALLALVQAQAAQAQWAQATGGDSVTQITDADGIVWNVHTFTAVGTSELTVTQPGQIEYLVVGGGGAGGRVRGGGGGAGGMLTGTVEVAAGTMVVGIGAGGTGDNSDDRFGQGADSALGTLVAKGGGRGGRYNDGTLPPTVGGSGGAGGGKYGSGQWFTGAQGTAGQGNRGGNTSGTSSPGGAGGGGAGARGQDVGGSVGGLGGIGVYVTWADALGLGDDGYFAGGGGGNSNNHSTPIAGGKGGGGQGARSLTGTTGLATSGMPNTGGGGGGAGNITGIHGGNGGSGIVVVRYQLPGGAILVVR